MSGNVEGADLQNKSQSTTHVDPQVGTETKDGDLPRSPENCLTSSVISPEMTMSHCGGKSQAPGHLSV